MIDLLERLRRGDASAAEVAAFVEAVGRGSVAEVSLAALADEVKALVLVDLERAAALADEIVRVAASSEDGTGHIRGLTSRAHVRCYANRFEDALEDLEKARQAADDGDDRGEAGRVRLAAVQAHARLGRLEEAAEAAREASRLLVEAGDREAAAKAAVNLGVVERMRGRAEEAIRRFDEALAVLGDDPVVRAQIESNRAEALLDVDDFARAEAAFRSALTSFERTGHGVAAAIVEGNLADLMGREGRLDEALRHFERARRRLEDGGPPGDLARIAAEEAATLATIGLHAEAADRFDDALARLRTCGLSREAVRAGLDAALVRLRLEQFDDAERLLDECDACIADQDLDAARPTAVRLRARLRAARGGPGEACTRLGALADSLRDRPAHRADVLADIAEIALRDPTADAAMIADAVEEGLRLAERLAITPLRARLLGLEAIRRRRGGEPPGEVVAVGLDALRTLDRVRSGLPADRVRSGLLGAHRDVHREIFGAALELDDSEERGRAALTIFEFNRARSLRDLLRGGVELAQAFAARSDEDDPETAALLDELARVYAELNLRYDEQLPGRAAAARLRDGAAAADRHDPAALEHRAERIERRLAADRTLPAVIAPPRSPEEIRAALREDEAWLGSAEDADGRLVLIVARPDRLDVVRTGESVTRLRDRLRRVAFQIGRIQARGPDHAMPGAEATLEDLLEELGRRIVGPIMPRLEGVERLAVSPSAALDDLPLAALRIDEDEGRLGERFVIARVPSASLLADLRARRPGSSGGGESLILGCDDADAPDMVREAERIAAVIPGGRVAVGAAATSSCLREAASRLDLLHIAAHGWFPPREPMSARIRLADGWMTARDLLRCRFDRTRVILAGCDTARAGHDGGEDPFGLVRALLAAGASAVLVSRWRLHDRMAAESLPRLHERLRDAAADGRPRTLAEATADWQREAADAGINPAFWAGLEVTGTG